MSVAEVEKVKEILKNFENSSAELYNIPAVKKYFGFYISKSKFILFNLVASILVAICYHHKLFSSEKCLISMPDSASLAFRSPENCEFCRNVDKIERVSNLSPAEFERNFAYNGKPVIVLDATANWTAIDVFSYYYFKDLHQMTHFTSEESNCQFFPVRMNGVFT